MPLSRALTRGRYRRIVGVTLMVVVMIYVDGGCQELPNELKNVKNGLWMWKIWPKQEISRSSFWTSGQSGTVQRTVRYASENLLIRADSPVLGSRQSGASAILVLMQADSSVLGADSPVRAEKARTWNFWAEIDGEDVKFAVFRGGKGGDCWEGARSTCQTSNPWTKTTKSHKIQQIARKLFGAIFVGIFEFGRKTTQSS